MDFHLDNSASSEKYEVTSKYRSFHQQLKNKLKQEKSLDKQIKSISLESLKTAQGENEGLIYAKKGHKYEISFDVKVKLDDSSTIKFVHTLIGSGKNEKDADNLLKLLQAGNQFGTSIQNEYKDKQINDISNPKFSHKKVPIKDIPKVNIEAHKFSYNFFSFSDREVKVQTSPESKIAQLCENAIRSNANAKLIQERAKKYTKNLKETKNELLPWQKEIIKKTLDRLKEIKEQSHSKNPQLQKDLERELDTIEARYINQPTTTSMGQIETFYKKANQSLETFKETVEALEDGKNKKALLSTYNKLSKKLSSGQLIYDIKLLDSILEELEKISQISPIDKEHFKSIIQDINKDIAQIHAPISIFTKIGRALKSFGRSLQGVSARQQHILKFQVQQLRQQVALDLLNNEIAENEKLRDLALELTKPVAYPIKSFIKAQKEIQSRGDQWQKEVQDLHQKPTPPNLFDTMFDSNSDKNFSDDFSFEYDSFATENESTENLSFNSEKFFTSFLNALIQKLIDPEHKSIVESIFPQKTCPVDLLALNEEDIKGWIENKIFRAILQYEKDQLVKKLPYSIEETLVLNAKKRLQEAAESIAGYLNFNSKIFELTKASQSIISEILNQIEKHKSEQTKIAHQEHILSHIDRRCDEIHTLMFSDNKDLSISFSLVQNELDKVKKRLVDSTQNIDKLPTIEQLDQQLLQIESKIVELYFKSYNQNLQTQYSQVRSQIQSLSLAAETKLPLFKQAQEFEKLERPKPVQINNGTTQQQIESIQKSYSFAKTSLNVILDNALKEAQSQIPQSPLLNKKRVLDRFVFQKALADDINQALSQDKLQQEVKTKKAHIETVEKLQSSVRSQVQGYFEYINPQDHPKLYSQLSKDLSAILKEIESSILTDTGSQDLTNKLNQKTTRLLNESKAILAIDSYLKVSISIEEILKTINQSDISISLMSFSTNLLKKYEKKFHSISSFQIEKEVSFINNQLSEITAIDHTLTLVDNIKTSTAEAISDQGRLNINLHNLEYELSPLKHLVAQNISKCLKHSNQSHIQTSRKLLNDSFNWIQKLQSNLEQYQSLMEELNEVDTSIYSMNHSALPDHPQLHELESNLNAVKSTLSQLFSKLSMADSYSSFKLLNEDLSKMNTLLEKRLPKISSNVSRLKALSTEYEINHQHSLALLTQIQQDESQETLSLCSFSKTYQKQPIEKGHSALEAHLKIVKERSDRYQAIEKKLEDAAAFYYNQLPPESILSDPLIDSQQPFALFQESFIAYYKSALNFSNTKFLDEAEQLLATLTPLFIEIHTRPLSLPIISVCTQLLSTSSQSDNLDLDSQLLNQIKSLIESRDGKPPQPAWLSQSVLDNDKKPAVINYYLHATNRLEEFHQSLNTLDSSLDQNALCEQTRNNIKVHFQDFINRLEEDNIQKEELLSKLRNELASYLHFQKRSLESSKKPLLNNTAFFNAEKNQLISNYNEQMDRLISSLNINGSEAKTMQSVEEIKFHTQEQRALAEQALREQGQLRSNLSAQMEAYSQQEAFLNSALENLISNIQSTLPISLQHFAPIYSNYFMTSLSNFSNQYWPNDPNQVNNVYIQYEEIILSNLPLANIINRISSFESEANRFLSLAQPEHQHLVSYINNLQEALASRLASINTINLNNFDEVEQVLEVCLQGIEVDLRATLENFYLMQEIMQSMNTTLIQLTGYEGSTLPVLNWLQNCYLESYNASQESPLLTLNQCLETTQTLAAKLTEFTNIEEDLIVPANNLASSSQNIASFLSNAVYFLPQPFQNTLSTACSIEQALESIDTSFGNIDLSQPADTILAQLDDGISKLYEETNILVQQASSASSAIALIEGALDNLGQLVNECLPYQDNGYIFDALIHKVQSAPIDSPEQLNASLLNTLTEIQQSAIGLDVISTSINQLEMLDPAGAKDVIVDKDKSGNEFIITFKNNKKSVESLSQERITFSFHRIETALNISVYDYMPDFSMKIESAMRSVVKHGTPDQVNAFSQLLSNLPNVICQLDDYPIGFMYCELLRSYFCLLSEDYFEPMPNDMLSFAQELVHLIRDREGNYEGIYKHAAISFESLNNKSIQEVGIASLFNKTQELQQSIQNGVYETPSQALENLNYHCRQLSTELNNAYKNEVDLFHKAQKEDAQRKYNQIKSDINEIIEIHNQWSCQDERLIDLYTNAHEAITKEINQYIQTIQSSTDLSQLDHLRTYLNQLNEAIYAIKAPYTQELQRLKNLDIILNNVSEKNKGFMHNQLNRFNKLPQTRERLQELFEIRLSEVKEEIAASNILEFNYKTEDKISERFRQMLQPNDTQEYTNDPVNLEIKSVYSKLNLIDWIDKKSLVLDEVSEGTLSGKKNSFTTDNKSTLDTIVQFVDTWPSNQPIFAHMPLVIDGLELLYQFHDVTHELDKHIKSFAEKKEFNQDQKQYALNSAQQIHNCFLDNLSTFQNAIADAPSLNAFIEHIKSLSPQLRQEKNRYVNQVKEIQSFLSEAGSDYSRVLLLNQTEPPPIPPIITTFKNELLRLEGLSQNLLFQPPLFISEERLYKDPLIDNLQSCLKEMLNFKQIFEVNKKTLNSQSKLYSELISICKSEDEIQIISLKINQELSLIQQEEGYNASSYKQMKQVYKEVKDKFKSLKSRYTEFSKSIISLISDQHPAYKKPISPNRDILNNFQTSIHQEYKNFNQEAMQSSYQTAANYISTLESLNELQQKLNNLNINNNHPIYQLNILKTLDILVQQTHNLAYNNHLDALSSLQAIAIFLTKSIENSSSNSLNIFPISFIMQAIYEFVPDQTTELMSALLPLTEIDSKINDPLSTKSYTALESNYEHVTNMLFDLQKQYPLKTLDIVPKGLQYIKDNIDSQADALQQQLNKQEIQGQILNKLSNGLIQFGQSIEKDRLFLAGQLNLIPPSVNPQNFSDNDELAYAQIQNRSIQYLITPILTQSMNQTIQMQAWHLNFDPSTFNKLSLEELQKIYQETSNKCSSHNAQMKDLSNQLEIAYKLQPFFDQLIQAIADPEIEPLSTISSAIESYMVQELQSFIKNTTLQSSTLNLELIKDIYKNILDKYSESPLSNQLDAIDAALDQLEENMPYIPKGPVSDFIDEVYSQISYAPIETVIDLIEVLIEQLPSMVSQVNENLEQSSKIPVYDRSFSKLLSYSHPHIMENVELEGVSFSSWCATTLKELLPKTTASLKTALEENIPIEQAFNDLNSFSEGVKTICRAQDQWRSNQKELLQSYETLTSQLKIFQSLIDKYGQQCGEAIFNQYQLLIKHEEMLRQGQINQNFDEIHPNDLKQNDLVGAILEKVEAQEDALDELKKILAQSQKLIESSIASPQMQKLRSEMEELYQYHFKNTALHAPMKRWIDDKMLEWMQAQPPITHETMNSYTQSLMSSPSMISYYIKSIQEKSNELISLGQPSGFTIVNSVIHFLNKVSVKVIDSRNQEQIDQLAYVCMHIQEIIYSNINIDMLSPFLESISDVLKNIAQTSMDSHSTGNAYLPEFFAPALKTLSETILNYQQYPNFIPFLSSNHYSESKEMDVPLKTLLKEEYKSSRKAQESLGSDYGSALAFSSIVQKFISLFNQH